MAKRKSNPVLPLEERMRLARLINEHRNANPEMKVGEVIKALKLNVKDGAYYAWNVRLKQTEAVRAANGGDTTEFPLAAIPERPRKPYKVKLTATMDTDKQLAAALLEVAAILLKR